MISNIISGDKYLISNEISVKRVPDGPTIDKPALA